MAATENILITGASGCVGHYLLDCILPDPAYRPYLLVRDPARLRFDPRDYPQVTVLADDLVNIERHAEILGQMDLAVHTAASWGGEEAFQVNVGATHRLFNLLDPGRCRKVLYFSTASILDRELRPIPLAGSDGTEYIRSKYQAYVGLGQTRMAERILTLFPTLILGGDARHPYTFLSAGLPDIFRWRRIFRFLTLEGSFHFIHARDIGRIAHHLLQHDTEHKLYVLGNPPLRVPEAIAAICRFYGTTARPGIDLSPVVDLVAKLIGIRLSAWDRFCMAYRDFVYDAVEAADFGLPGDLRTLEAALRSLPNLSERLVISAGRPGG